MTNWSLRHVGIVTCFLIAFVFGGRWLTESPAQKSIEPEKQSQVTLQDGNSRLASSSARMPIEDISVGDRVLADNPQQSMLDDSEIEPDDSTWLFLKLRMPSNEQGHLDIEMIRSPSWLANNNARVGGSVFLNLEELGANGEAEILRIDACPKIHDGPGQVVVTTFAHPPSYEILDLKFTNELGNASDSITVTGSHPFWIDGEQDFVAAREIELGESVRTHDGRRLVLASKTTNAKQGQRVFNLEVHSEHVYFVGENGILVHNMCAARKKTIALGKDIPGAGYKELAAQHGGIRWQFWKDKNITLRQTRKRFGRAYHDAAKKADEIHFSLDGIDDAAKAAELGKRGYWVGNMTNAELNFIKSNADILSKTKFFKTIDGVVTEVGSPF